MTAITLVSTTPIQSVPFYVTRLNNSKVNAYLDEIDWELTKYMKCPNEIYNFLTTNITSCYNKSKYQQIVNNSKRNKSIWVDKNILKLSEKRDKLFLEWIKDTTNKELRARYNKIRNKTNKAVHKSRNNYFKMEINKNRSNMKNLWQIINNIMGKITNSIDNIITKAFASEGNNKNIADKFAIQFQKNVKTIIPNCSTTLLDESQYTTYLNKSMLFPKATDTAILKIIKSINLHKAPGADEIRAIDILRLSDKIVSTIVRLINTSIATGTYPNQLKTGIIRPVHKGGSTLDYGNYRPITILPVLDKIIEKYVCNNIQNFYSSNNVLSTQQYGFQPKKSTTLLLSRFTDDINACLNEKKHVLLIFIDYSKAFDTLKHDRLIKTLENSGVRGKLLEWCKDYLSNRKFKVKVADMFSDSVNITEGTAQGSVLGPLHYLTYVNDLNNVIKKCTIYQFADDTCLVAANKDVSIAQNNIQADFTAICKWSHDAGLVLNADKTKFIHVHSSHNISTENVKLIAHSHGCLHRSNSRCEFSCSPIEKVVEHKYLGLVIDNRFNWAKHIEKTCTKLRAILAKFNVIKFRVPFGVLITLYKALAESIISYGLSSYGRTFKTYLDQIYNIQLRLLKTIVTQKVKQQYTNDPAGLFKFCGIIPIHKKVHFVLLLEQFFRNEIQIEKSQPILTRSITNKILLKPKFNNLYGKRTSQYYIPDLINKLPVELKDKINKRNIKQLLKKYYLNLA